MLTPQERETLTSPCGARATNPIVLKGREEFSHYGLGSYVYGPWVYGGGLIAGGTTFVMHHAQSDLTIAVSMNASVTLPWDFIDLLDMSCKELEQQAGAGPDVEYFSILPCEDDVYSCEGGTEEKIDCPSANSILICKGKDQGTP